MSELHQTDDIETKANRGASFGKAASGSSEDVALAFDEFMRAFEAFKATNEERLQQIEQQLTEDVVTTEKLERINRAIDQHKARGRPAHLEGGAAAARRSGVRS